MKAEDIFLTALLEAPRQFIVPIFQRDYSWGTKHCLQLWKDVLRVGANPDAKGHFVGSVVYIAAEGTTAKIPRWLIIDGQQRLTTLTLLLIALKSRLPKKTSTKETENDEDSLPTRAELDDYYLRNAHGVGDRLHKLRLRRADQETLAMLLDGKELPANASARIRENYEFFEEQLNTVNPEVVYRGVRKLLAVDVKLTRGQDDPQMIFESLNSTGIDLTQADLIRNFVLMSQEESFQTQLYQDYWQPIEVAFGVRYRSDFDKFVRDYLTLQLKPSKQLRSDEIYHQFRSYYLNLNGRVQLQDVLGDLKRYGTYYVAYSLGHEKDKRLKEVFRRLRQLIEVASPVILRLYDCYFRHKTLPLDDFITAVRLLESYVFRRSVCDMQTRSLGQIFANLAYRIKDDAPLLSLKVALYRQGKKRRYPSDAEFKEALETRDVYDMRSCHYLLDRLENDSKENIDTSTFSIEHVMPQNEELCPEWQAMLGKSWKETQELWLHRLGNVTLTGYNSEYSDKPFDEKKSIKNGFSTSPLRLNKYISEQKTWTATEMEQRGKELATKALKLWPQLVVDMAAVKDAELSDRKAQAARFNLDALDFDAKSRKLFDMLRKDITALGSDVVELCGAKSVTYRVYDFFVEIIPRKRKLVLNINLDFDECNDPSERIEDSSKWAFIPNASETGGAVYIITEEDHIGPAMHILRQAYESVSD